MTVYYINLFLIFEEIECQQVYKFCELDLVVKTTGWQLAAVGLSYGPYFDIPTVIGAVA